MLSESTSMGKGRKQDQAEVVMFSQQRPQPNLQRALNLGWPFRGGKRGGRSFLALANHWLQVAPKRRWRVLFPIALSVAGNNSGPRQPSDGAHRGYHRRFL